MKMIRAENNVWKSQIARSVKTLECVHGVYPYPKPFLLFNAMLSYCVFHGLAEQESLGAHVKIHPRPTQSELL